MSPAQIADLLTKSGISTVLIIAIIVLWSTMKKQAAECKAEIHRMNTRVSNLMNQQADNRARIAELEAITVRGNPNRQQPRSHFTDRPEPRQ